MSFISRREAGPAPTTRRPAMLCTPTVYAQTSRHHSSMRAWLACATQSATGAAQQRSTCALYDDICAVPPVQALLYNIHLYMRVLASGALLRARRAVPGVAAAGRPALARAGGGAAAALALAAVAAQAELGDVLGLRPRAAAAHGRQRAAARAFTAPAARTSSSWRLARACAHGPQQMECAWMRQGALACTRSMQQ
jgi:hypothetical protein